MNTWWLGLGMLAITPTAAAWGNAGHRVVAEVAEEQLRPQVRAEIKRLLAREVADATLASVASWADDHRSPATSAWHYVNIPREAACRFDRQRDCSDGRCVVAAIERQAHVLAAEASDDDERLKALKYLVHLVGDIHQPLHAGYEDDRGGNKYQLRAFERGSNLHALWDTGLIEAWPGGLPALRQAVASDTSAAAGGDPKQWAEESCRVVATPGFYPNSRKVGEDYQHRAGPIVRSRLASAGRRLAQLLNANLTSRYQ
jgi:nuclease S1